VCINLDSFKFYVIANDLEKHLNSSNTAVREKVAEMDVLFSRITTIAKITSKCIAVYISPPRYREEKTTKVSLF
jgi:hypothetical protein